ncbi:MAG TPA: hypothetical protein PLL06_22390, partial [Acidobacteriota bacterium]|nr:hypothetical protein [Acidobacteriota bacterium]
MKIKSESLPVRCEICHQSDLFDPVLNQCERCRVLISVPDYQNFVCVTPEIGSSRVNRPGRIHINPGIYLLLCFLGGAIGLSEYDAWLKIGFTFKWLAEIWIWVGIVSLSFPLMVGIAKLWRDRRHKLQIISDNTLNWVSLGMIFLLIGGFILAQARISSLYWDHRKVVRALKNIHEAQGIYQTQLGQG